jgi:hypothetical protein
MGESGPGHPGMCSYVSPEGRIPLDCPLAPIDTRCWSGARAALSFRRSRQPCQVAVVARSGRVRRSGASRLPLKAGSTSGLTGGFLSMSGDDSSGFGARSSATC